MFFNTKKCSMESEILEQPHVIKELIPIVKRLREMSPLYEAFLKEQK